MSRRRIYNEYDDDRFDYRSISSPSPGAFDRVVYAMKDVAENILQNSQLYNLSRTERESTVANRSFSTIVTMETAVVATNQHPTEPNDNPAVVVDRYIAKMIPMTGSATTSTTTGGGVPTPMMDSILQR